MPIKVQKNKKLRVYQIDMF